MKRFVNILFVSLLLISLSIFVAFAGENEIKKLEVQNLQEMIDIFKSDRDIGKITLVLKNDISESSDLNTVFNVTYPNDIVLDLNGHNLIVTSNSATTMFEVKSGFDFSVLNSANCGSEIGFNTKTDELTCMFRLDSSNTSFSCYGNIRISNNALADYCEFGGDISNIFLIDSVETFVLNGIEVISYAFNPVFIDATNISGKIKALKLLGDTDLYNGSYSASSSMILIDSSAIDIIDIRAFSTTVENTGSVNSFEDVLPDVKPIRYFEGLEKDDFSDFTFGNISANTVFKGSYLYSCVVVKGDINLDFICSHSESNITDYSASGHIMTCKRCGAFLGVEAHSRGTVVERKEPTCTVDGNTEGVLCSDSSCNYLIVPSEIIKAQGHKEVVDPSRQATCTENGYTQGSHCSICSKILIPQQEIEATGHNIDPKTIVTISATCSDNGSVSGDCTKCKNTVVISSKPLGHDFTRKSTDEKYVVKEPTYIHNGTYFYSCKRCHKKSDKIFTGDNKLSLGTTKKLTATQSTSVVKLTWTPVKDATGYRVYQKVGNRWEKIASIKTNTFRVTGLTAGKQYSFYVRAYVKEEGQTIWAKNNTTITTSTEPKSPSKVSATQSTSVVKLTWKSSSGATGYRVYKYNTSSKKYEVIASVKDTTTYRVTNLKSGTIYKFKIKPYIKLSNGKVIWGAATSALETATEPAVPKLTVRASLVNKGRAVLSWSNVSGESGYQLYYSTSPNGTFRKKASFDSNTVTKTLTSLKSSQRYYFKIRAYKDTASGIVYGQFSEVKSVKIR